MPRVSNYVGVLKPFSISKGFVPKLHVAVECLLVNKKLRLSNIAIAWKLKLVVWPPNCLMTR